MLDNIHSEAITQAEQNHTHKKLTYEDKQGGSKHTKNRNEWKTMEGVSTEILKNNSKNKNLTKTFKKF
jgi:hypothetical protein